MTNHVLDLPEQYKAPETLYKELDAQLDNKTDRTTFVYTTIPIQFLDSPEHPDGHTECMVLGNTKAQIMRSSNYLFNSIPKVAPPGTVVIKDALDGSGLGMFAERDIKFGELVLAERPLLMQPAVSTYTPRGGAEVDEYTFEQHISILRHEQEMSLEVAVGRMSARNQVAYKALENAHTEDGSGPLLGVVRTNGFGINIDELTRTTSGPNLPSIYSVVLKDGSRINHRCLFKYSCFANDADHSTAASLTYAINSLLPLFLASSLPYATSKPGNKFSIRIVTPSSPYPSGAKNSRLTVSFAPAAPARLLPQKPTSSVKRARRILLAIRRSTSTQRGRSM